VQRGFAKGAIPNGSIVAIPAGLQPVQHFLTTEGHDAALRSATAVIVMGLCGGLNRDLAVGDAVIYASCEAAAPQNSYQWFWPCATLAHHAQLLEQAQVVRAISCDRVITTAEEKRALHAKSHADVVDMEGTAILEYFVPLQIPVAMLRIVSDDAAGDIPDLVGAIDAQGKLRPLPLAIAMLKAPLKAIRLIRGALRGLQALEQLATQVAMASPVVLQPSEPIP
jgi:nucleoside phosphorylase